MEAKNSNQSGGEESQGTKYRGNGKPVVAQTEEEERDDMKIEIKSYFKKTFAGFYFPKLSENYALKKLRTWINHNPELHRELYNGPEGPNDQSFSRRQVKVLIKYLGEP